MSRKTYEYPIEDLREILRDKAVDVSARLSRSVARKTSADSLPCLEYGDEVAEQMKLSRLLGRVQLSRQCLEKAIAGKRSRARLHGLGTVSMRKCGPARIRVDVDIE